MINDFSRLWDLLPEEIRSYIISIAANLTTVFSPQKTKKNNILIEELEGAFKQGITFFISHFPTECHYFLKKKRLRIEEVVLPPSMDSEGVVVPPSMDDSKKETEFFEKPEVVFFFTNLVRDDSYIANSSVIEKALYESGIDLTTIDNFNLKKAIISFYEGFLTKAERSEKLILLLLYYLQIKSFKVQSNLFDILKKKEATIDELKSKYFNYIREKFSLLSFKGLSTGQLISIPLKTIYVEQKINRFQESEAKYKSYHSKGRIEGDSYHSKDVSQLRVLDNFPYSVITGDPGSGKSTLLKFIALAFAENKNYQRLGIEVNYLPIIVPISAYSEILNNCLNPSYSLKDFFRDFFKGEGLPDLSGLFKYFMINNKAMFLLDGLDEVKDDNERNRMVEHIRNFISYEYNFKNKYVITCRTASYTNSSRFDKIKNTDFIQYELLPFDSDQIKSYLTIWYIWYNKTFKQKINTYRIEAEKCLTKTFRVIRNDKNIFSLATNPLMLTVLALIEHEGGQLPENRVDLYKKCITLLSGYWENTRSLCAHKKIVFKLGNRKITEDFIVEFLGTIAYEMHRNSKQTIEFRELKVKLAELLNFRNNDILISKDQASEFIQIMREKSGILQEISINTFKFTHLTFQEYLAARFLTDISENRIKDLGANILEPNWKEIVLLTFATLSKRDASNFLNSIINYTSSNYKQLHLAGECLRDFGRDKVFENVFQKYLKSTLKFIHSDHNYINRFKASILLGHIGDPRNLEIFIKFNDLLRSSNLKIKDTSFFEISKYPVTYEWYKNFIEDNGYENDIFWSNEGKIFLTTIDKKSPLHWNEERWNISNKPVIGVSWYEASAFTNWLSLNSEQYIYRLPSKFEWETVSKGVENRKYSWGNKWYDHITNSYESDIQQTSPVGIFQKQYTPEGVSDLCGNVWECTSTDKYSNQEHKDFQFLHNQQFPIIKGGSWGGYKELLENDKDYWVLPTSRNVYIGFRCVRYPKK